VRLVSADPQGLQIARHPRRRGQDGRIFTPEPFDSYGAGPVRLELSGIYPVDRAEEILLPDIYAIVAQDRVGSH
jgi:hypothetical protein